ncbi:MAG: hypothetical protein J6S74_02695 [Alphaproteobacteria bacterium]|nr:hypothetical protein [Alphaproteobacteria bacterium]
MAQKTKEQKLLDAKLEEEYELKFQELMDLIPQSNVFKKEDKFEAGGVVFRSVLWTVGEYTIDSDFRIVSSIEADDKPEPRFCLSKSDYRKFVKACEARRAEVLQQHKIRKTK